MASPDLPGARGPPVDLATRARLLDSILREPGLRIATLAQRLGVDYTTVRHHVRALERGGQIRGVGPGQRRWFPPGSVDDDRVRRARLLSAPSVRQIREHVRRLGVAEASAIAPALGLGRSTVTEALARLGEAGEVSVERRGGRIIVRAVR